MTTRRNLLLGALGGVAANASSTPVLNAAVAAAKVAPFLTIDFTRRGNDDHWSGASARWFTRFEKRVHVAGGRGRIVLPAPLASAADSQTVPVFLLDHDSSAPIQRIEFAIEAPQARPGVIIGATDLESYLGVTIEDTSLVLSRFERTRRVVLHRADVPRLAEGHAYALEVRVEQDRILARVGRAGSLPGTYQLDIRIRVSPGMPGVLMLAEPPMGASEVALLRYKLGGPRGSATPVRETYLLSGTPSGSTVDVRVGTERVTTVVVESSRDPGFLTGVERAAAVTTAAPTFTTKTALEVGSGVWWRAVLTDPVSGARSTTAVQSVAPADLSRPLVLGAASCAQLWNAAGYHGLTRFMQEAAPTQPAMLVYQGDFGYPSNSVNSCLRQQPDFYLDRITRFLRSPDFIALRAAMPVGFTMDDHEYGPQNNADRTTLHPWTIDLWNSLHADPSATGYIDWRFGDVHCVTLDGRRYCVPVNTPESPAKTKLGPAQKQWLRGILERSDARLFVIFSADIFASRGEGRPQVDCWWYGWKQEYAELMMLFHDVQMEGRRVVILSGDAHGQRIHHHPDPAQRERAGSVVEFICAGLRARSWSMEHQPDPTIDPKRRVEGKSGLGMITIDPPRSPRRTITLRSINGDDGPLDLFPPLRLSFTP